MDKIDHNNEWSLDQRFVKLTHLTYRPILEHLIHADLLDTSIVTNTGKWGNVIIDVSSADGRRLLYELYRLIENCFDSIGWWTGNIIKDDKFNKKFRQLVTVHPDVRKDNIISFYRYGLWKDCINEAGEVETPMNSFWNFSQEFMETHKDKLLELWTAGFNVDLKGTEWQNLLAFAHHSSRTGLAWAVKEHNIEYFIGKMTIPADYPPECRDLIIAYLEQWFKKDDSSSAMPKSPYIPTANLPEGLSGLYKEDKELLVAELSRLSGWKITTLPGMFDEYLKRIPHMEYIWTVKNWWVYESGMVSVVNDVDVETRENHYKVVDKRRNEHPENTWRIRFGDYQIPSKKV